MLVMFGLCLRCFFLFQVRLDGMFSNSIEGLDFKSYQRGGSKVLTSLNLSFLNRIYN